MLVLALLVNSLLAKQDDAFYGRIVDYLNNPVKSKNELNEILKGGSMDGFYTTAEMYKLIVNLSTDYPHYVAKTASIGKTFQSNDIMAYTIGDLSKFIRRNGDQISNPIHSLASFSRAYESCDDCKDND